MEELRRLIDKLSDREAKSLLFHTMLRIKMIQETSDVQGQVIDKVYSMQDQILTFLQSNEKFNREYETVHIAFGDSPAGSLKEGLGSGNKIITLRDRLDVGPISDLHKESGRNNRYKWLQDHLNVEDDYIEEEYESNFKNLITEIESIPNHIPIVIWTAENACEETGFLYMLYLLQNKTNDIYVINSTIAYEELFHTSEIEYTLHYTGEATPEKLNLIYNEKKLQKPLSAEDRNKYEEKWMLLSETKEVVRVWKNREIKSVEETYFDKFIITATQDLHAEQGNKKFIKAGRLIGEIYGLLSDVNDTFIEYRVRNLIYKGILEIKGIPKGMRYYSIRLNEVFTK